MPFEDGVEANVSRLRDIAKRLRDAEFTFDLPQASEAWSDWDLAAKLRMALAFILAGVAPLLAVRQGLAALRCVSCKTRWPQAYPVLELALGLSRAWAVAVGAGLACYTLLDVPAWRLGILKAYWNIWTFGIPLAFSLVALYSDDARDWRKLLEYRITVKGILKGFCWIAVVALIIMPPRFSVHWLPEPMWWLPLRWREALIGLPSLLMAFYIHLGRIESRQSKTATAKTGPASEENSTDPRHWLLLGLIGPIVAVNIFGRGVMPPETLLLQSVGTLILGAILGGALIAAMSRWGDRVSNY
jgi:hypothetical protein